MSNRDLNSAKAAKCDEFYTQLTDIEHEMRHYKEHFRGKTVYCNCDTADSNFVRYFQKEDLGLKRLIYTGLPVDFRSPEAVALLEESDIVVTNPPFSLFRDYISLLAEHGKKFLVLGNLNAVTYKEIFPLIEADKLWLGVSITSGDREFEVPARVVDPNKFTGEVRDGRYYQRVMGVRWFTNLKHNKRNEEIDLYRTYNNGDYQKYTNGPGIEVSRVKDIPADYDGVMGVPISFLDKYNPTQFEIVGHNNAPVAAGQRIYKRILIKRRLLDYEIISDKSSAEIQTWCTKS